jgi:Kef-type K+ transport system membrane component KefB
MLLIAMVLAAGLLGPLLSISKRYGIPVAIGEILVGVLIGASGLNWVDTSDVSIKLLSQIGFALVMMWSASKINIQAVFASRVLGKALRNVAISVLPAVGLAYAIASFTGFDLAPMFAVIMFSSSAALLLPAFSGVTASENFAVFTTQIAIADLLSIVVLPLSIKGSNFTSVLVGALTVSIISYVIYKVLKRLTADGRWAKVREVSKSGGFGLELRLSLIVLLTLAGLAQSFGVTIMIAGFAFGLAIAANGLPHRLGRQIFAVTEGFFSPLFFVVLGAQIDIRALFSNPNLLLLSAALFVGALLVHLSGLVFGLPARFAVASAAQLGVPTAAIAIGQQTGVLSSGQAAAIMLAALLTIGTTLVTRRQVH